MIWRNEAVLIAAHIEASDLPPDAPMKSQIIEQLGQVDILLPALVADGLAANDRIKVRMSALQAAAHHARQPEQAPADLQAECRAAGIAPAAIATLIVGAHMAADGR